MVDSLFGGLLHDHQITKFFNSLSNFPDMISLSSNYSVLRSNVHRTMFAPQCFQMISILLDFDTKVEMVKFEKTHVYIVHAF